MIERVAEETGPTEAGSGLEHGPATDTGEHIGKIYSSIPEQGSITVTDEHIATIYTLLPRYLRGKGATREQSEDGTQHALERVLTRAQRPPALRDPVAYAYRVGQNWLFTQWNKKEMASDEIGERPGLWFEPDTDLDRSLQCGHFVNEALKACDTYLSRRQSEVFHLLFEAKLTPEQAAEVMGLSLATVQSHLYRGTHALARNRSELWDRLLP
ncbi:RNA polymerase sigma factor [Kitasatospora sp. NBC_00315]|uniref:RNA polymerase sigma factor n=1 Tax=Kitasatospora sp. NBC_00315 TaxID=2975963 RepID=UPI00324D284B